MPAQDKQQTEKTVEIIFPAFKRLHDYLLKKRMNEETIGFIIGRATHDLWAGALAQAAQELGEQKAKELEQIEDPVDRITQTVALYQKTTGTDLTEKLSAIVTEIVDNILEED